MSLYSEGELRRNVHARIALQHGVLVHTEQFMRGPTNEGHNFYLLDVWRIPLAEWRKEYQAGARFDEYCFTGYKRDAWLSEQGGGIPCCTFCWREVPCNESWQEERYPKFLMKRGEEITLQMQAEGRVSSAVTGDLFSQV